MTHPIMYVTDNENKMKSGFKKEERSGCMSHLLHSSVSHGIDETPDIKSSFNYCVEREQKKRSNLSQAAYPGCSYEMGIHQSINSVLP